jgi:hypothetical protein
VVDNNNINTRVAENKLVITGCKKSHSFHDVIYDNSVDLLFILYMYSIYVTMYFTEIFNGFLRFFSLFAFLFVLQKDIIRAFLVFAVILFFGNPFLAVTVLRLGEKTTTKNHFSCLCVGNPHFF